VAINHQGISVTNIKSNSIIDNSLLPSLLYTVYRRHRAVIILKNALLDASGLGGPEHRKGSWCAIAQFPGLARPAAWVEP
jgi:hypothetical protein